MYRRIVSTNISSESRAQDVLAARTRRCRTPPSAMFSSVPSHPAFASVACRRKVDHRRQRCQQGVVRPLVAAQEAADDARALGSAAAEFVEHRQRSRRAGEHRQVGRRPHSGSARQDVRIALREHDEVSLSQTDGLLAHRVPPARAPRDQVVLDDALSAGHHDSGDLPRRRRFRHPRRAQLEVEVHRAGQADRAKHVREDVSLHGGTLAPRTRRAGRASIRFGRAGRSAVTSRRAARDIGRWLMASTRGRP